MANVKLFHEHKYPDESQMEEGRTVTDVHEPVWKDIIIC